MYSLNGLSVYDSGIVVRHLTHVDWKELTRISFEHQSNWKVYCLEGIMGKDKLKKSNLAFPTPESAPIPSRGFFFLPLNKIDLPKMQSSSTHAGFEGVFFHVAACTTKLQFIDDGRWEKIMDPTWPWNRSNLGNVQLETRLHNHETKIICDFSGVTSRFPRPRNEHLTLWETHWRFVSRLRSRSQELTPVMGFSKNLETEKSGLRMDRYEWAFVGESIFIDLRLFVVVSLVQDFAARIHIVDAVF